jgi:sensor histidine kinase YesM
MLNDISNLFSNFYGTNQKRTSVEKEGMNTNNVATKPKVITQVNDIGFRLILIPFFGIAIPLVTGMVNARNFSNWEVKLSFLYTIFISFIIWQGNRYLLFTLRSYFNWFNKPIRKVAALLLAVPFYTIPVSSLLLIGWYHIFSDGQVNWSVVNQSTMIIMICVIFIVHVYETVFLVKEAETEKVQKAQMEKAKAEAELEALKNQIDPHFIFNSLNTLSHLIEEKPERARQFNENLADVYRYILQNKGRDLVLLADEINFLKDYFSLLKIRFEQAVQLNIHVDEASLDQFLIPAISLQILAENAIKHNEFSNQDPLVIDLWLIGNELVIKNQIKKKVLRKLSSRIGLQNLNERYKLLTKQIILVTEGEKDFTVTLPVLKIE